MNTLPFVKYNFNLLIDDFRRERKLKEKYRGVSPKVYDLLRRSANQLGKKPSISSFSQKQSNENCGSVDRFDMKTNTIKETTRNNLNELNESLNSISRFSTFKLKEEKEKSLNLMQRIQEYSKQFTLPIPKQKKTTYLYEYGNDQKSCCYNPNTSPIRNRIYVSDKDILDLNIKKDIIISPRKSNKMNKIAKFSELLNDILTKKGNVRQNNIEENVWSIDKYRNVKDKLKLFNKYVF